MKHKFKPAPAIVLGMHDAIVSLGGLVAGLTFASVNRKIIILSTVIASVSAGLSMGASCYLAEKTNDNNYAIYAGVTTCIAYIGTCILLIAPFFAIRNAKAAFALSVIIVVTIILVCNLLIRHTDNRSWKYHFLEMLIICTAVSIISFLIGEFAQRTLGIII